MESSRCVIAGVYTHVRETFTPRSFTTRDKDRTRAAVSLARCAHAPEIHDSYAVTNRPDSLKPRARVSFAPK